MLQGLLIRQLFFVVDLAMAIVVAGVACLLVLELVGPETHAEIVQVPALDIEDYSDAFAVVGTRESYQGIVTSAIFGTAASFALPEEEPEPEPEQIDVEETELKMRLLGTTVAEGKTALATAIIEITEGPKIQRAFYLNEELIPQVTLIEIRNREVVLDNQKTGRLERLTLEEDLQYAQVRGRPARQRASSRSNSSNRVVLDREEIIEELQTSYTDIVTKVKPKYVRDDAGKVIGITADNIESFELAKKLNLKNGDVLQTINNERIDSEERIFEVIEKYRNSTTFRLGILRNGRPQVITYRLE